MARSLGLVFYTYTPIHVAQYAKMLRKLTKELRILGLGLGRVGIYVIWWRDWYPDVLEDRPVEVTLTQQEAVALRNLVEQWGAEHINELGGSLGIIGGIRRKLNAIYERIKL